MQWLWFTFSYCDNRFFFISEAANSIQDLWSLKCSFSSIHECVVNFNLFRCPFFQECHCYYRSTLSAKQLSARFWMRSYCVLRASCRYVDCLLPKVIGSCEKLLVRQLVLENNWTKNNSEPDGKQYVHCHNDQLEISMFPFICTLVCMHTFYVSMITIHHRSFESIII